MNTEVAILHHDYPAETRETVDKKLQGLARFFDGIHGLYARLEKQGGGHRVELVAHVGRGPILKAEVTRQTFKDALGESVDRMRGQLSRHRDRVKLGKHRSAS
ncbi:MAG TPA: HPF/RaiA family ribosome-associated protein [Planctomycetes bacterium]|nr:HPF/RaiA family ribosome-associated protein [Planctomycetota bacterium]HIK59240.1 HPF/RaiA family ribosome-associated protein [Planctomycetota bacterium]